MAINKTEQGLEDRLINKIAELERQIIALRTPQGIGGDVFEVALVPETYLDAGPLNIAGGAKGYLSVSVTPANPRQMMINFQYTVFVDTLTDAYAYPNGTSLSAGQLKMYTSLRDDLKGQLANPTTLARIFHVDIENYDSVAHNYYIRLRALIPRQEAT